MRLWPILLLAAAAACTPAAVAPPAAPALLEAPGDIIADGRAIAEAQCASCHAIGASGESPRADAPPLRIILEGESLDAIKADFTEGLHLGHKDMPAFALNPQGVDALFAYVESLRSAK